MRTIRITILVVLAAIFLSGCGGTKIDLMDYVDVTFKGINGRAKAIIHENWVDFEEAIVDDSEIDYEHIFLLLKLEESIDFSLDKSEGLSNGETVILSVTWDKDVAKSCGFKFVGKDKKIKISELADRVEVDLMDFAEVEYSGVHGKAEAVLKIFIMCLSTPPTFRARNI